MRGLRRHAAASVVTAAAGVAVALIATPLIIHHVGRSGYGAWTLAMAVVIWVGVLEAGAAPAVQRAVAAGIGRGESDAPLRVLWATLAAYGLAGALLGGLLALLAPVLVRPFDLGPRLTHEATLLLRIAALALPLGLVGAAVTNVLAGLARFERIALTALAGALGYLTAIVLLVSSGAALHTLAWAVVAQQSLLLAGRGWCLRDVLRRRPRLLSRGQAREIASISARLQLSAVSVLVNSQTDRVVTGLVAAPGVIAQVAVGGQLAESGRSLAIAPLIPITSRFAALEGAGDGGVLRAELTRLERLWTTVVTGGVAIGAACAAPLVRGWLGEGYGRAGLYGAMLVLAYGVNLLVGVRAVFLRATGRPGLEARTALVLIALNVLLTVPLAIAFGAVGVVGGTLAAHVLAAIWFARRFVLLEPVAASLFAQLVDPAPAALAAAALAAGWGLGVDALIPPGWALPLVALGAGAAFAGYIVVVLGVRPTPAALGELLRQPRGTSTSHSP